MFFLRMVFLAFWRQKGKMAMIAFTIALGASLATAMLNVMFGVGDKVNQELKTYGANIRVVPQAAGLLSDMYGVDNNSNQYLKEDELGKIKTIFWAYNIVDFAPYLEDSVELNGQKVKITGTWFNHHLSLPTGEELDTGMISMKNWWHLKNGGWLTEQEENFVMVGQEVAEQFGLKGGDVITLTGSANSGTFTVKSLFDAGGEEDKSIFMNLAAAQKLTGKSGLINSIEVSALTSPDNELARKAAQNPESLTNAEREIWYCTAYVSSICYQIQEVITNAIAKPVRQVAESEGAILNKTQLLMLLITILSLIGSALGISNLVTASVMERSKEIGLLKAIGAHDAPVAWLILTEIIITAIIGGVVGYFAGCGFAQIIGKSVFGSAIPITPTVIPLVVILIFLVTMAGSVPSIRMILKLEPAEVLHGR